MDDKKVSNEDIDDNVWRNKMREAVERNEPLCMICNISNDSSHSLGFFIKMIENEISYDVKDIGYPNSKTKIEYPIEVEPSEDAGLFKFIVKFRVIQ